MITKIGGILALSAIVLTSCQDGQVFPDEPYLEYQSYRLVGETEDPDLPINHAVVDLYFTDGDGNIGEDVAEGDFNLFVNVFEQADTGGYVFAYDWNGLLEDLTDEGQQNKVLEGVISYKVGLSSVQSDSCYIEFQLIDDDGNASDVVETERIFCSF